jgi:hypothetical protein
MSDIPTDNPQAVNDPTIGDPPTITPPAPVSPDNPQLVNLAGTGSDLIPQPTGGIHTTDENKTKTTSDNTNSDSGTTFHFWLQDGTPIDFSSIDEISAWMKEHQGQVLLSSPPAISTSQQTHPMNPEIAQGRDLYFQIWGVKPPPNYIAGLVAQGLNAYEIAQHEMAKPAFGRTRMYRDQYADRAQQLAQALGRR